MQASDKPAVPGLSSGILMPKQNFRFCVQFYVADGKFETLQPWSSSVMRQITKFYLNDQYFGVLASITHENNGSFEIEDDVKNAAAKVLYELGTKQTQFDVAVNLLDGNGEPVEQVRYHNCQVTSIMPSAPLDYSASPGVGSLAAIKVPNLVGNLVEDTPSGAEMLKLLNAFFNQLEIRFENIVRERSVVSKVISFSFESQSRVFSD